MNLPRLTLLVYSALMLIGGLWGYIGKRSAISLIAGVGSAVVLFGIAFLAQQKPKTAAAVGIVAALMLTGNFLSRFIKAQQFLPNGLFGIVSILATVALVIGLIQNRNQP